MKKNIFFIICTFILKQQLLGQVNLVPNPSFEDTLHCPFNPAQVSFAPPWYDPTGSSSDYYNACNMGIVGVPNNISGYQMARIGNAYVGEETYVVGWSDHREYIQTKLLSTLLIN